VSRLHRHAICGGDADRPFILIAVADYAEGEARETPHLLELGFDVEHFGSLPLAGGLWDQPAGLMRKVRQVMNVYHAVKMEKRDGRKPGETAKWRKEHEDIWEIVSEINELRENYG
jgi:hypothetical protein